MRKISYWVLVTSMFILLQACGSATLGTIPGYNTKLVNVKDNRNDADRSTLRDSVLSAIIFFGDEDLDPNLKEYFIAKLANQNPQAGSQLNIVINQFRVADFFPKRMSVGIKEWVFMPNTDTRIVNKNDLPRNADMIICYFDGMVNGKKVIAKAAFPYTLNAGSAFVRSDPNFVIAVNRSIDTVVKSVYQQLK